MLGLEFVFVLVLVPTTVVPVIIVLVVDGILGTVTSLASAEYLKIWLVALKSPLGSAVTIMIAFCW